MFKLMKAIICFKKHGPAQYISHLDLQRTVDRAIRRSGVDAVYTEGFNPHIKMSFAFALKVGLTSESEYLEVELADDTDIKSAETAVRNSFPEGLTVNWLKKKKPETKKLMASVAKASYDIVFSGTEDMAAIASAIETLMNQDTIELTKHTKKGPKRFNARPLIDKLTLDQKTGVLTALLGAQEAGTLDPALLISKILLVASMVNGYTIIRKNLHFVQEGRVLPLSELAEE